MPKVYDQETYEDFTIKLYDSNCRYEPKKIEWREDFGDPFSEENLNSINTIALEEGYDTFEIIKTIDNVVRYQVVDEDEK